MISICTLTSPAHARIYAEGIVSPVASLHFVGDGDTADVHHMVGRTAALFGSAAGVACFTGGHKLPTLSGFLRGQFEGLRLSTRLWHVRASSVCVHASMWLKRNANHASQFPPAGRVCSYVERTGRCLVATGLTSTAPRLQWQCSGVLRLSLAGVLLRHASEELPIALESITCHTLVLSKNDVAKCFVF